MSVLALIPARGGSKGIPRKNIKMLGGKPLIGWTIDAAKQAKCIEQIVVSTDDQEIAAVSLELGADVPFLRPYDLAADDSPSIGVVMHAIEKLPNFDWVLLLQPTSPLRTHADIDAIFHLCDVSGSNSAVSISLVTKHPYWMYLKDDTGRLQPFLKDRPNVTRRQELPAMYNVNGAMYLAKTKWLFQERKFIDANTLGYVMPSERSLDLDTPQDWGAADFMMGQI